MTATTAGTPITPAPVTRQLGAFVASMGTRNIPAEAFEVAKLGFTDCIGTMLAGGIEDAPRIVRDVLKAPGGASSLLLSEASAPAPEAALINGVAAHALDYDDVALRGHPSTVIVPAILAEADEQGSSGADCLRAFIAGYEVWAEIALRDPDQHHMKGWHPTGIFGAPAAAAACAVLLKLDAETTAHALALAVSGSAGLMANFGSMTKPFHAGQSARAGSAGGPIGQGRFHGVAGCVRASARLSQRHVARRQGRPHQPDQGRHRMAHPRIPAQYQEIPDLLRHASGHRRHARLARGESGREGRRRRQGHGSDQPPQPHDPAQCAAQDRARSQVLDAVRDGLVAGRASASA